MSNATVEDALKVIQPAMTAALETIIHGCLYMGDTFCGCDNCPFWEIQEDSEKDTCIFMRMVANCAGVKNSDCLPAGDLAMPANWYCYIKKPEEKKADLVTIDRETLFKLLYARGLDRDSETV